MHCRNRPTIPGISAAEDAAASPISTEEVCTPSTFQAPTQPHLLLLWCLEVTAQASLVEAALLQASLQEASASRGPCLVSYAHNPSRIARNLRQVNFPLDGLTFLGHISTSPPIKVPQPLSQPLSALGNG